MLMPPPAAYVQQPTSSPSPFACLNPSLKEVTEIISKKMDGLKEANQNVDKCRNLCWQEKACNRRTMGVNSGPPQNAWRVSRVTKSFHFLCSKGIAQTRLRNFSCLSIIYRRTWAEKQKGRKLDT